jgi:hypothetical protein
VEGVGLPGLQRFPKPAFQGTMIEREFAFAHHIWSPRNPAFETAAFLCVHHAARGFTQWSGVTNPSLESTFCTVKRLGRRPRLMRLFHLGEPSFENSIWNREKTFLNWLML